MVDEALEDGADGLGLGGFYDGVEVVDEVLNLLFGYAPGGICVEEPVDVAYLVG